MSLRWIKYNKPQIKRVGGWKQQKVRLDNAPGRCPSIQVKKKSRTLSGQPHHQKGPYCNRASDQQLTQTLAATLTGLTVALFGLHCHSYQHFKDDLCTQSSIVWTKKRVLNAFSKYYKSIHRHYFFVSKPTDFNNSLTGFFLPQKCSQKWCLFSHVLLLSPCQAQLRLVSALFAEAGGGVVE